MRFPRRIREFATVVGALIFAGAARAHAAPQTPPSCKNFGLVGEWKGTLSLVGTGSGALSDGGTYSVNESITASPDINAQGAGSWTGNFNETIHIDDMESHPDGTFTHITDDETIPQGPISAVSGGFLPGAGLNANLSACNFQFSWDPSLHATVTSNSGTETGTPSQYGFIGLQQSGSLTFSVGSIQSPLPTTGLVLSGNAAVNYFSALLGDPANWTLTWSLNPVLDLDLIVTIPQYSTWRPTAGLTELDTGLDASGQPNLLTIQALLITKSTQQPTDFPPENLTFLLAGDSHEPGVTMNWPPEKQLISPTPPDLNFDKNQSANANFQINSDGTQAQIAPTTPPIVAPVTIVLSPHDWGGWGTLNVTATVDGETITGHFRGDPTPDILIPKRQPGRHVADVWKSAHNISLTTPDTDDSETDPVGKPGCVGDGFTLYEEYRGFIENRKHIEGDPSSKDFFILNDIGADAEPGIFLFTAATGLTVHKDLRDDEAETQPRPELEQTVSQTTSTGTTINASPVSGRPLMNFNHNEALVETNQYGVLLRTCNNVYIHTPGSSDPTEIGAIFSGDGGVTFYENESPTADSEHPDHAHPALDDFICLQPPDSPGTLDPLNNHNGVISAVNAVLQYDVAVSHELSHSVGVLHHGDRPDEGEGTFTLLFTEDPRNTTGKPVFFFDDGFVKILDEKTGADEAAIFYRWFQDLNLKCLAYANNPSGYSPSTVELCQHFFGGLMNPFTHEPDPWWTFDFQVGLPHGKHSGDDQCSMRYPFAKIYPKLGDPTTYYMVPAGSEPLGTTLCASPVGTGVNASTHIPQPRFGDARSGRGACLSWACVNDYYPTQADQQ